LITRIVALLTTLVAAGLLTPLFTTWARSEATDMRILLSVLLLAPPAFCMGMMFPLGLGIWRRHSELLPFFWSANGITSMFASVLGMVLSIEFGIASTYALGACLYVVCACMIVGSQANRAGVAAAGPAEVPGSARQHRIGAAAAVVAPSIQPLPVEPGANIKTAKPAGQAAPARVDEAIG
jgi:hypothetical protein